jgi:hypothetical protein
MAVAAFFISPGAYTSLHPGEVEQGRDPLFSQYKEMAQDQSWLEPLGLGHKTWTFAYGHDKALAKQIGCDDIGTHTWDHACVIVWKTSADGTYVHSQHTTHFDEDFSKNPVITAEHIKKFILSAAGEPIKKLTAEI